MFFFCFITTIVGPCLGFIISFAVLPCSYHLYCRYFPRFYNLFHRTFPWFYNLLCRSCPWLYNLKRLYNRKGGYETKENTVNGNCITKKNIIKCVSTRSCSVPLRSKIKKLIRTNRNFGFKAKNSRKCIFLTVTKLKIEGYPTDRMGPTTFSLKFIFYFIGYFRSS